MGKSKRRIIAKGKYKQLENFTRDEAVLFVLNNIKKKEDVFEVISLFGLKADELLEAGADYEDVKTLGSLLQ